MTPTPNPTGWRLIAAALIAALVIAIPLAYSAGIAAGTPDCADSEVWWWTGTSRGCIPGRELFDFIWNTAAEATP